MIDVHTLYLAGLISQATFTLTLVLLAWSDQRTKGTVWLAAACALQFAWTATRFFGRTTTSAASGTIGACLLVVLLSFVYMGLRWFVVRKNLRSRLAPSLVGSSLVLILMLALFNADAALLLARVVALTIGVCVIVMLWQTKIVALRMTARFCASMVIVVMFIMGARLITKQPAGDWVHDGHMSIYAREGTVIAVTLLSFSFIALFVGETNRRLHDETRIDVLTGLRNRRALEEEATRLVQQANLNKTSLALLMMDLDRFKTLNDTWGHAVGDRALRMLGTVLIAETGSNDVTARMGGEEFAVLLPGRDIDSAAQLAERLRESIAAMRLKDGDKRASLTVSIGVSVLRADEACWDEMLARADDALYCAKREGRDRVKICALGPSAITPERDAERVAWRRRWSLPKAGPML
jgi:diguanylate cyclase (GGDEF)-like protein